MSKKHPHLGGFSLFPPKAGTCPECAALHEPEMPHDPHSLYYQYNFYGKHKRWPDWNDALEHCGPEMKKAWIEELNKRGIKVKTV